MQAILISIGSELTSGRTVNTNAAFLARRLQSVGIPCRHHLAVPDDRHLIVEAIRTARQQAELVIVTGGLGPTFDDITAEAIAEAAGRPLAFSAPAAARVRRFYRQHRRRVHQLALRQAAIPRGATALPNPVGTAPGIWLPLEDALLVALPGVPREMEAIVEGSVLPRLRRTPRAAISSKTVRTIGVVELQIQEAIRTITIPSGLEVGLYPNLMAVDVSLTMTGHPPRKAQQQLDRLERALRRRLGEAVYGRDDQTLEDVVSEMLMRRRLTLAVAESCTGGLVADRLTNVPGSSRYLIMSVVAYHNRVKQELLGVSPSALTRYGAVSSQVAAAMAQGARRRAGTDVGLAITGIAGPTGATSSKPVGLVYMALADRRRTRVKRFHFHGDRRAVKEQAAQMALDWLRRWALGMA